MTTERPVSVTEALRELHDNIPLASLPDKIQELLVRLNALTDEQKAQINRYVAENILPERSGKETFVAPDLISTLAPLARNVQALENFFQKSEGLTNLEIASGYLHYEPIAQFTATIGALQRTLEASDQHPELLDIAREVNNDCSILLDDPQATGFSLGGKSTELFLKAVAEHTGIGKLAYTEQADNPKKM